MKKYLLIGLIAFLFNSCTDDKSQNRLTNLSATEFLAKTKQLSTATIIDVRTAEEFAKGHLKNAFNIDWNGSQFVTEVAKLDKTKPVFVYCLSGGRSASATNKLLSEGFTEIYEMNGGIMKWRGANLPEVSSKTNVSKEMTKNEFDDLLNSDKIVLIDFYADWCAPCKKMKPYLDEISKEMADQVEVIRINADDNQALCKEMNIDALPVLQVYKNKDLTWTNTGFINKAGVVEQLQL